ncbi:uncharacterized protein LOC128201896 [Galleria mellonella]|uniref:Uncharacterized protein LOC128201896 n=1 Tax=Galleria mellonella TaxID=7137 RepID=A0ABM3MXW8_GALME|nr:uncharacterized protein LOC128201896 [Galleria mellonella]
MFSNYFASIYGSDTQTLLDNNYVARYLLPSNLGYGLTNVQFSKDEVLARLKTLDVNKGAGSDGIPPLFIRACAENLAIPIHLIFNLSLKTGIFPSQWKLAKHGFVKARSVNTNLVTFADFITEAVDTNLQVDAIYTDFSKAFDSVPHNILLQKLSLYGFADPLLSWLRSKCLHIKFTRKHNKIAFDYHIYSETLSEVSTIRDLGILLDSKLTYLPQIEFVIAKASRALGFSDITPNETLSVDSSTVSDISPIEIDCTKA